MERSVASFQSMIDGAKLVRDLSSSVLIGASTAASGGLAGAVGGEVGWSWWLRSRRSLVKTAS